MRKYMISFWYKKMPPNLPNNYTDIPCIGCRNAIRAASADFVPRFERIPKYFLAFSIKNNLAIHLDSSQWDQISWALMKRGHRSILKMDVVFHRISRMQITVLLIEEKKVGEIRRETVVKNLKWRLIY